MIENFTYIPKYVKQDSDLEYGEKVTHENYNEKLNLNTTQGDYNTMVLDLLLNNRPGQPIVHIPYLDTDISDINTTIGNIEGTLSNYDQAIRDNTNDIEDISHQIENILDGEIPVEYAHTADSLDVTNVGANKYYGTNANAEAVWLDTPEFLYAVDMETSIGVDGVYYVPALNSVAENMLTAPVREKLNRSNITDYDYLTNRPLINSVLLTGNVSLNDLGIQPAGNYVTDTELTTALADYSTTNDTQSWVNTQLGSYATTSALSETNDNLSTTTIKANNAYTRAYACARVGVNAYPTDPQEGDIYFTV